MEVMVPKGGSHLLAGGSHGGNTFLGAAHGENPLGECPQVDTELWDAHEGTTIPPRGCPRRGTPENAAWRGWRQPEGRTGTCGRLLDEESAGKRERRRRRAGREEAAARRLRTCGPGADREDLEVKRWQIVKKVIVRCPIYYGFIVG